MTLYCTLADVRAELKPNSDNTTSDAYVLGAIRTVSRRIDREFAARRPLFAPYIETRRVRVDPRYINTIDGTFWLGPTGSLLSFTGLVVGDDTLTVGTHVAGFPDTSMPPFTHLHLLESAAYSWYYYAACADDGYPLMAQITGIWGLHRDYANAWMHVDDLQATITDSGTTVTVADDDGADAYGLTPRFSPGNLIKIDDEFMEVTAVASNSLTVRRGVNGSTAAAHTGASGTGGANISTWQVEEPIRRAVARQTAFLQARRGAYESVAVSPGGGEIRFPGDLLSEVRAILNDYAMGL